MPEAMPQWSKRPDLSDDDKRTLDFTEFIKERGFTAEQLRTAYYHVLAPEDYPSQPEFSELAEEMKRLVDTGFPINRFMPLIGTKEQYEDAVQSYELYVERLPVSSKEQAMLKSILHRKRAGKLFLLVGGKEVAGATVKLSQTTDERTAALQLLEMLEYLMARAIDKKQMEFRFEE